jgi:hypothetical protein
MQLTNIHKTALSAIVVVILLGGYIYFDKKSKNNNETIPTVSTQIATTSSPTGLSSGTTSQGLTYTLTPVSPSPVSTVPKPIPDLNRALAQSPLAVVSEADRISAGVKIKELQSALKGDPKGFANWIELGLYQKLGGDYDGAIISWKYASRLRPTDFVSLGNIGNLYAYNLKNNTQAEVYYKQAIAKGPKEGYLYYQLAEIYRDFFYDTAKAKAIIDQGLSQLPGDPVLLQFKASLG